MSLDRLVDIYQAIRKGERQNAIAKRLGISAARVGQLVWTCHREALRGNGPVYEHFASRGVPLERLRKNGD